MIASQSQHISILLTVISPFSTVKSTSPPIIPCVKYSPTYLYRLTLSAPTQATSSHLRIMNGVSQHTNAQIVSPSRVASGLVPIRWEAVMRAPRLVEARASLEIRRTTRWMGVGYLICRKTEPRYLATYLSS
jgi:hypothetical protein